LVGIRPIGLSPPPFVDSLYIRYNNLAVEKGKRKLLLPAILPGSSAGVKVTMPSEKRKNNPYSGIVEKVEQIIAGIAEQMPNLTANDLQVVRRAAKVLARNTRAGAERLAILHVLGTNESVPGTMLYQLCSQRVEKRVRELQSIGMDIRRWSEIRPDGYCHSVYGWSGFREWQEHRLLHEGEDKQPSLKRVM
jgi:hypothetical protein